MKALWRGTVIAESQNTIEVEENYYFPPQSVNMKLLRLNKTEGVCPWRGAAKYYDIVLDEDHTNVDAARTYPNPSNAGAHFKNYIAFWNGVEIIDEQ